MSMDDASLTACWFLAGPTASGKSDCALILAEMLGAEIVALDSMTLYRGLDIGTAKPSPADRLRIPHHLLDILDPATDFSVADYVEAAEMVVRDILQRGKTPLFVGGSGLYLRSILRGVFQGPPADPDLRAEFAAWADQHGKTALHEQLRAIDPVTAARLPPNDIRRVIRALEVHRLTGLPLSAHHQQSPRSITSQGPRVFWLDPPRDWLHDRINRRVIQMFEMGWIEEVRGLLSRGVVLGTTARQALGYQEILAWISANGGSQAALITEIQTRTRQFAKRQHTWFRNLSECTSLPVQGTESPENIAQKLVNATPA